MVPHWVHVAPHSPIPHDAVMGGHDCDSTPIYVGRAFHEGDQLPAKVVPSKGCAYVAWGGKEHAKTHYEVLVGHGYTWARGHGGGVPPNAVRCGRTNTGEVLYVGRAHYKGSMAVGKIHISHGCIYIPFAGEEVKEHNYEVLISRY